MTHKIINLKIYGCKECPYFKNEIIKYKCKKINKYFESNDLERAFLQECILQEID